MSSNETNPRSYLMVRLPMKWIAFFILGLSLVAGVATIVIRHKQLQLNTAFGATRKYLEALY